MPAFADDNGYFYTFEQTIEATNRNCGYYSCSNAIQKLGRKKGGNLVAHHYKLVILVKTRYTETRLNFHLHAIYFCLTVLQKKNTHTIGRSIGIISMPIGSLYVSIA